MILQRYVLRELSVSFAFTALSVMAVCLLGTMFQLLRAFEGLGLELLLRIAPVASGYVAPWALLVASCTAATLVYGRMAADNEVDAMRLSGVHTGRILSPAIFFGLVLCGLSWIVHEHAAPAAHYARRRLVRESVVALLKLPPPGPQRFSIGPYKLSYADYREGRMERPALVKYNRDGREVEYYALQGRIQIEEGRPPRLVLSRPTARHHDAGGNVAQITADGDVPVDLEIAEVYQTDKGPDDMTRLELWDFHARVSDPRKRRAALLTLHSRTAQAAAPLLLVLVAVPIGILVKRGSRLAGLGAALPPLILYFVAFFVFQGIGDKGRIPPAAAAWAPNGILLAVALALLAGVFRK